MSVLRVFFTLLVICLPILSSAQNIGAGADAMYNFQTESFGVGARVSFLPNSRFSFVPEFSYYFPFNQVTEYYAGLAIELKVLQGEKAYFYVLGHGGYNEWLNHEVSPMKDASRGNWNAEFGGGISTFKCLRPFIEYRYNVKFKETHLRLGFLYVFGCRNGGGKKHGGGMRRGRFQHCAAYD